MSGASANPRRCRRLSCQCTGGLSTADLSTPVLPAGEDREATGQLLSIDNQDGVVKLDQEDVKMLQLRYLCKLHV